MPKINKARPVRSSQFYGLLLLGYIFCTFSIFLLHFQRSSRFPSYCAGLSLFICTISIHSPLLFRNQISELSFQPNFFHRHFLHWLHHLQTILPILSFWLWDRLFYSSSCRFRSILSSSDWKSLSAAKSHLKIICHSGLGSTRSFPCFLSCPHSWRNPL